MNKWRVDYAYRKGGLYCEGKIFVIGNTIEAVLHEANAVLCKKAIEECWDRKDGAFFRVWDIGIVTDADEEVF